MGFTIPRIGVKSCPSVPLPLLNVHYLPQAPLATLAAWVLLQSKLSFSHQSLSLKPFAQQLAAHPASATFAGQYSRRNPLLPPKMTLTRMPRKASWRLPIVFQGQSRSQVRQADSQGRRVVLASDQHVLDGDQTGTTTLTPGGCTTPQQLSRGSALPQLHQCTVVHPYVAGDTRTKPACRRSIRAIPGRGGQPYSLYPFMAIALEPRDAGPSISAMGAMNTAAMPAPSTLTTNAPSISEANVALTGAEPSVDAVLDMLRSRVQAWPPAIELCVGPVLAGSRRNAQDG